MRFQSVWTPAMGSAGQLFAVLSHADNLKKLMPEQVLGWRGDADSCTFTIQGVTELSLQVTERVLNEKIRLVPVGQQAFPFYLQIAFRETPQAGEVRFEINAELNPFLEMMAKRPLQHLVDAMAAKVPFLSLRE